jgi:hypothetical protein
MYVQLLAHHCKFAVGHSKKTVKVLTKGLLYGKAQSTLSNCTWYMVQHVRLLWCKLHWPVRLLCVGFEPNCCLISRLQWLLGPPLNCAAVNEPQPPENPVCLGVWWDGCALDVLYVAVGAAVVTSSSLQSRQTEVRSHQ